MSKTVENVKLSFKLRRKLFFHAFLSKATGGKMRGKGGKKGKEKSLEKLKLRESFALANYRTKFFFSYTVAITTLFCPFLLPHWQTPNFSST